MDPNDQLRKYVTEGSHDAFRALVDRYAGLIYSAARRQMGDPHLAEDVTQAVLILLAQKARSIPIDRPLGAWLLRTTAYVSSNARRQRALRDFHEQKAAEMIRSNQNDRADAVDDSEWSGLSPILDQAVDRLARTDREALVMRYFEKMSLGEVGAALGITEAAAAKRVSRAVEKLRKRLTGRGVEVSTASLAVMLLNNTVLPLPTGLVSSLNAGVAPAASAVSMAKGAIIVTASTKLKFAAAAAILLLAGSTVTIVALAPSRQFAAATVGNSVPSPSTLPVRQLTESSVMTVYFADGTGVSLIGITQANGDSQTWWGYDGMPVPAPNFPDAQLHMTSNQDPRRRAIEMVFRIDGEKIKEKTVSIFPVPNSGLSVRSTTLAENMYKITGSLVEEGVASLDLNLRIAYEPWAEAIIWQKGTDGEPLVLDQAPARVTSIQPKGNELLVEIPYQRTAGSRDDAERVLAVLLDGRRLESIGSVGQQGKQILRFGCRPEELFQLVLGTRPFEQLTIPNIPMVTSTVKEGGPVDMTRTRP